MTPTAMRDKFVKPLSVAAWYSTPIYMKTDIPLLAHVFENSRNICINVYKLDPAQYVSAPGLPWDVMLRFTGLKLELFVEREV